MNDEKKCPNTVLYSVFLNPYSICDFKAWHKKYKNITCRVTLCGREMITSVHFKSVTELQILDAGKGNIFFILEIILEKTHPSVCCKKMSKSHSHVYQKNPKR